MRFAERLARNGPEDGPRSLSAPAQSVALGEDLASISARLHARILDRLDLAAVAQSAPEELKGKLRVIVLELLSAERLTVSGAEQGTIVDGVLDELLGHGPLENLLKDPSVSDVLVNGCDKVYVERAGKLSACEVRFRDNAHLTHTIQRMVARVGRRIDESSPMVDARLADGSRINAVLPPLAVDGPSLSIRRFGARPLSMGDLVLAGALSEDMRAYLQRAVRKKRTILIAGGTGAGKTTLLNGLSSYVPASERIITVEDAAELRLQQPHVVRLEARPPNLEGKGEVTIRDLVKNALRMRPDRIVVGEVRGAEVLDMLQAMNTGHDGSLVTIHANSAEDALGRLMTMLGMSGSHLSEDTMGTLVTRALHVVLHVSRMPDGKRRVTKIVEVVGKEGHEARLHPIFAFEEAGQTSDGTVLGRHVGLAESALLGQPRATAGSASGQVGA